MVVNLGTLLDQPDIDQLAHLQYAGAGPLANDEPTWRHLVQNDLPWLEAKGLKLHAAYSRIGVEPGTFTVDPGIQENLPSLANHGTVIWLPISSKGFVPSDEAGDNLAVAAVRQVAEAATQYGLSVSLYPHWNNLLQRVEDAVRIANKTNLSNVGVTFNLCHWLRTDGRREALIPTLKLALPRLSLVTINGADWDAKDWKGLIQPLDSGNFDQGALLSELRTLGYRGPIGLQGYDVAKNFHITPLENLKRSMAAWKKLNGEAPA